MKKRHLLLLIFLFSGILSSQGATFKAISDGIWTSNIWDKPGFPGVSDDVIIDGFTVTILGPMTFEVNSLTLINSDELTTPTALNLVQTSLNVSNQLSIFSNQNTVIGLPTTITLALTNSNLEVGNNFVVLKEIQDTNLGSINIMASDNSSIEVIGDMSVEYNAANAKITHSLSFSQLGNLTVGGTFTSTLKDKNTLNFSFSETATLKTIGSIILYSFGEGQNIFSYNSTATSNIEGNLLLSGSGVNGIFSEINHTAGILNVDGELSLISDDPSQKVSLHLDGVNNLLMVGQGISLDASDENTAFVILDQSSILDLGSSIDRVTDFGNLFMQPTSLVVFNFDTVASLPSNNLVGSQSDIFELTNIKLVNTSGSPIELDGPMVLNHNLDLDEGILKTDSVNLLILGQNATISGGNENTYIDGPIEKRGNFSNNFIFPVGNKGIYAPIEITPVTDPNSIFQAEFFGDPPPIGGVPPDIDRINDKQYWIIDRTAGSEPVDVVLHWTDGQQSGISSLDSITTTYFDPITLNYVNGGRGVVTGGNGPGQVGSIGSNMLGDPPPIGAVAVTIGTVSTNSVLPVELSAFNAVRENKEVQISWTTSSEIDASHFEIERSSDGIEFSRISSHTAEGEASAETFYKFMDKTPIQGTNYYRLRSVDIDGFTSFSRIRSVNFGSSETPIAVPNPVKERLQILGLGLSTNAATVEIFTSTGQMVFQREKKINDGEIELEMTAVNINSKGTYYLRIITPNETHNITVLKTE